MSTSPNFDGFRDAQRRLRQHFGHDLTFHVPTNEVWPDGVAIDPETGAPYDPTVEPESGGAPISVVVKCNVAVKPKDSMTRERIGWLEAGGILIIADPSDWHLIRNATEVEYAGETYKISHTDHDYLGSVDRFVVYARQA